MSTKTYIFNGKAKWAKVREGNIDPEFKNYQINVYFTPAEIEKYDRSGLRLQKRTDDEGTFVIFKRNDEDVIKGDVVKNGPPSVYLRDAQSGEYNLWKTGLIGNGSKVAVAVDAFDTSNGIGSRLQRVFVDDLIVYEGKDTAPETAKLPF